MSKKTNNRNQKLVSKQVASTNWVFWWPWLFGMLGFILYVNTIGFGYVLDDSAFITENKYVQDGVSAIFDIFSKGTLYGYDGSNEAGYRPVMLFTLAVESSIFGNTPQINHLVNLLLYGLLLVILTKLLLKWLADYPHYSIGLALLIFTTHPIHTEVVANIKSRDEILCMLFGILSLYYAFLYHEQKKVMLVVAGSFSLLLSLLSKENGFAYLAIVPLSLYFFTKETPIAILKASLPYLLVVTFVLILRWIVLDTFFLGSSLSVINNSLVAATSYGERLATTFSMLLYALGLLVFPLNLSWDYSYNTFPIVDFANITVISSVIIHLTLLIVAIWRFRNRSLISFIILFYFATYILTSNLLFLIGSSFAERFLFAPSLAICMILPALGSPPWDKWLRLDQPLGKRVILSAGILIAILFSIRTVTRNWVWKDNLTLDTSGVISAPNSARTHYAYADDYSKMFRDSKSLTERKEFAAIALPAYQRSLDIYDKDSVMSAEIYLNMGMIKYHLGDTLKGVTLLEQAYTLCPEMPSLARNLSSIYSILGDTIKARHYSEQALK